MKNKKTLTYVFLGLMFIGLVTWGFVEWVVNRIYVPIDHSLMVRYKGPLSSMWGLDGKHAQKGHFAKEGEIGVLAELRGPGRHFLSPIWYETTLVKDKEIKPGEIGIVTCKVGDPLPDGEFLVEGDIGENKHKGILRKALAPGKYRIHPYAYDVKIETKNQKSTQNKISGWLEITTGYTGVVTNKSFNPITKETKGVQNKVLPPGIYLINGKEQEIDVVEIGYREVTVQVKKKLDDNGNTIHDESGEPQIADESAGINFPSNDGFPINVDFTAVWGVMPKNAPSVIRTFGNIDQVEHKVILPQIESICRTSGSRHSAVELLVGESRQEFQEEIKEEFKHILADKHIELLYGLVRHIYIPTNVRKPIQSAFIADELKLTREQEQLTAVEEGNLREAEKQVDVATEEVRSETKKLVAHELAKGEKIVGETEATTTKLVASIDKETAAIETQAKILIGEAETDVKKMEQEAKAQLLELAVSSFGTPQAYNNWAFATDLPENIELNFIHAGPGTLWTDMENIGIRATIPVDDNSK